VQHLDVAWAGTIIRSVITISAPSPIMKAQGTSGLCGTFILTGLLTSLTCVSGQAAEYCLGPYRNAVVCCTTPAGWYGWKDEPHSRERIKELDEYSRAVLRTMVSFHQPNCKEGPECPSLALITRGRDSRGKPDIQQGLRGFLNESEQPQDASPRRPPCLIVSHFGSFHTGHSGAGTIWQVRCPSGSQHLLTLLALRDMLVIIDLEAPDIKEIVPKLHSLKELARSVRRGRN